MNIILKSYNSLASADFTFRLSDHIVDIKIYFINILFTIVSNLNVSLFVLLNFGDQNVMCLKFIMMKYCWFVIHFTDNMHDFVILKVVPIFSSKICCK